MATHAIPDAGATVASRTVTAGAAEKRVRVVRLRVIGGSIDIRDDVPADRAGCPTRFDATTGHRVCGHVRCEWHLWMIDGRDRPGRRHPGRRLPSSELRPVWLEWPLPPSCGADLLASGATHGWTSEQKARALGLSVDSYQWALRNVMRKLRDPKNSESLREFLDGASGSIHVGSLGGG